MQAMNILQHKFTLINQANEPQKEHVKISDTAKFQGCWPNTHNMADIGKTKIRAKCRIITATQDFQGKWSLPQCHVSLFVSCLLVFRS